MIKYEWRTRLEEAEAAELADLLERAAHYDAEPEYGTIDIDDVTDALGRPDSGVHHLVIWMLPYATGLGEPDHAERIAGLLRVVTTGDGAARASIVIDPRLRSIGITTLLLEQVGLDTSSPEGWLGTGVRTITGWAQGNHPAAGRLSNRFLIPRTRRVWKLIRSTESVEDATAAPVLEELGASPLDEYGWAPQGGGDALYALREDGRVIGAAAVSLEPVESEEFGPCATVTGFGAAPSAEVSARRRLLEGAAAVAHDAGLRGVIIHVDSDDTAWVNPCRVAGFQHDRTDVRFQLGGDR